jgi:hypothetical protein
MEDPYPAVSIAQVADCSSRDFTDQKRLEMSMQEFIDHWVRGAHRGSSDGSLLYLKDWHFVKVCSQCPAHLISLSNNIA